MSSRSRRSGYLSCPGEEISPTHGFGLRTGVSPTLPLAGSAGTGSGGFASSSIRRTCQSTIRRRRSRSGVLGRRTARCLRFKGEPSRLFRRSRSSESSWISSTPFVRVGPLRYPVRTADARSSSRPGSSRRCLCPMYSDLSEFLADLDKRRQLVRIADRVSPTLEIAAVTDRACKSQQGGPALLFENPSGFDIPVATNIFGSLERMQLALGVSKLEDLEKEIDDLMTPPAPKGVMDALKLLPVVGRLADLMPKTVKDAPCQEVVNRDGTLDELPILTCWPGDGGPFITLPLVFTRDPETGTRNIGVYRMQVFDGRTTGMHWKGHKGAPHPSRGGGGLGRRLEVGVALSPEPILAYCATAPMPEGLDELLLGGFLSRRRIEVVKCVTVDLEVPASSHIVLEGYVEPGERRREGPFGDHTGFYSQPDDYPVFHLTCVTR